MTADDEDKPFSELIGKVRPVKQDRVVPPRAKPKPVPEQTLRDEKDVVESLLSDDYDPGDVQTGDELLYAQPGIQNTTLRKLRRGQYAIEAQLDLHGYTVPNARAALDQFIKQMRVAGKRCVRVIHGKGNSSAGKIPVLKGKVNVWLRQKEEVLAFCSAVQRDGGAGAVYVLLKRAGQR